MLDTLTPYQITLVRTPDELELFLWWAEQHRRSLWARLATEVLIEELYDAGIKSVRAVARLSPDHPLLCVRLPEAGWRTALIIAAADWRPLPEAWRCDVARNLGLHKEDRHTWRDSLRWWLGRVQARLALVRHHGRRWLGLQ